MKGFPLPTRSGVLVLALAVAVLMMGAAVILPSAIGAAPSSSGIQSYVFPDQPPGPPTGLTPTVVSTSEIDLSWTNPSGTLTDNNIYFWVANSCSGSPASSYDFGGVYTSYADLGLTPSTTYSYEVTANTSGGEGLPSNCATATTDSLGTPTGLAPTVVSGTEIDLSWTNPSGTLTDNNLYIWAAGTCAGGPSSSIDFGGVYTSYAATGLNPLTAYSFEVTASTSGVEGPRSTCVSGTTLAIGAPTGLTATAASETEIDFAWTNPVGPLTSDTINVYLGCSALATSQSGSVFTSFAATGLSAGATYCAFVWAFNSTGQSVPAGPAFATTSSGGGPPPSVPPAPTALTGTAVSSSEIDFAWTNPVGPLTSDTINVYLGCSALTTSQSGSVFTSFAATGLSAGATYCAFVWAFNSTGQSVPAGPAFATTSSGDGPPPSVPPAPTALTGTAVSSSEIDFAWTNPVGPLTSDTINVYLGCSALATSQSGSVFTSFAATGLSAGATYCAFVWAFNSTGQSVPAGPAFATTSSGGGPPPSVPPAPTALTGTAVSSSEIDFAWTNPVGPLTSDTINVYLGCSALTTSQSGSVFTSFAATGLSAGATYCAFVWAFNSTGQSVPAGPAFATTSSGDGPQSSVPPAPTGFTATAVSSTEIALPRTNSLGPSTNSPPLQIPQHDELRVDN